MTDTDMFPFDPSNIMGSEGLKAETRAAEKKATRSHDEEEQMESQDEETESDGGIERPESGRGAPDAVLGESWDDALVRLRGHFPDAKEGILFCVYKLLQDREANFRDFRDEAMTRGVGLSGRSLHSAKVLLGMAEPAKRKPKQRAVEVEEEFEDDEAPRTPTRRPSAPRAVGRPSAVKHRMPAAGSTPSVEGALRQAIAQIEEAAQVENARLKDAIRDAIEILQAALDD